MHIANSNNLPEKKTKNSSLEGSTSIKLLVIVIGVILFFFPTLLFKVRSSFNKMPGNAA